LGIKISLIRQARKFAMKIIAVA